MRLYAALLRLFPRAFRERFGRDMSEVFADHWREARRRGPAAACALIVKTSADMTRHAAAERRRARRLFPGSQSSSSGAIMDMLLQDIRFATRSFAARPGFTAVALITIALGIGANTAIFSVVRPLLLTNLPFPDQARIVHVYEGNKNRPESNSVANPSNYDAWEKRTDVFTSLAGFSGAGATLTGAGDPVRLKMTTTTPSLFDVFGTRPAIGRIFTAEEADTKAHVIVLGDELWRTKFGADPAIVNHTITLDGAPWLVTGIMPQGFSVPNAAEAWIPLTLDAEIRVNRNTWFLQVAGKLAPAVTVDAAQSGLTTTMAQLNAAFPKFNRNKFAKVVTWQEGEVGDVRQGLWMLQGVTLAVLLIACANLANLLLAHSSARARELAIRAAMGASRSRLVGQLLTEGLLLSCAGGLLGVGLAVWAVPALAALAPSWLPRALELQVGLPDLGAALALASLSGVAFSVLPALLTVRAGSGRMDMSTRTATSGRGPRLTRAALVACQVSLALALLIGAGLLLRSFARLTAQPIGFAPDHVLTAQLTLPRQPYASPERRRQLFTTLLDQLAAEPGVRSATASTALPFTWWEWMQDFPVIGRPEVKSVDTAYRVVSHAYFDTLGVPLERGRAFADDDTAGAPRVAVVNRQFARQYAALGDVIGVQLLGNGVGDDTPITIVGVVGDTRHRSFERPAQSELYLPLAQAGPASMTLAIRAAGNPTALGPMLRQRLNALDPNLPLTEVKTLDTWVGSAVAERRFYMVLLSIFAGLAATLAAIGIYGVMSYVVRLRTREIGIRIALGATAGGVERLIIRQGLVPVLAGALCGTALAMFGTKLLRDQLFQIEPRDPSTMALTIAALLIVAMAACWVPSRRTTRVDPAAVLRNDEG